MLSEQGRQGVVDAVAASVVHDCIRLRDHVKQPTLGNAENHDSIAR